jgi:hypothetical protein
MLHAIPVRVAVHKLSIGTMEASMSSITHAVPAVPDSLNGRTRKNGIKSTDLITKTIITAAVPYKNRCFFHLFNKKRR